MTWILWLGLALGAIAAVTVGLAAFGAAQWSDSTKRLVLRLEGTRLPATTSRYDAHELENLPVPVKRYFRAVLKDGQPIVSAVTVEHTGTFNLKQHGEQWKPFTSRQRVVTRRPGFVWMRASPCSPASPSTFTTPMWAAKASCTLPFSACFRWPIRSKLECSPRANLCASLLKRPGIRRRCYPAKGRIGRRSMTVPRK